MTKIPNPDQLILLWICPKGFSMDVYEMKIEEI